MPAEVLGPPAGGEGVQQLSQRVSGSRLGAVLGVVALPVLLVDVYRIVLLYHLLCASAQCHHCPDVVLIFLNLQAC